MTQLRCKFDQSFTVGKNAFNEITNRQSAPAFLPLTPLTRKCPPATWCRVRSPSWPSENSAFVSPDRYNLTDEYVIVVLVVRFVL